MATTPTGTVLNFNQLLFGDRFRFVGDLEGISYGPVVRTLDYVDGSYTVELKGGGDFYRSGWAKVVLLHRAPNCECGAHVDFCENECEWPAELETLWQSLYKR